jgi:hypothetical protein
MPIGLEAYLVGKSEISGLLQHAAPAHLLKHWNLSF